MKYIPTYITHDYLDDFFGSIPKEDYLNLLLSQNKKHTIFSALYKLIFENSTLYFDEMKSLQELNESKNPWAKKLIHLHLEGGRIRQDKKTSEAIRTDKVEKAVNKRALNVYLSKQKLALKKYGLLNIDTQETEKVLPFSQSIFMKIHNDKRHNTFPGWQILKKIDLPINSAIVVDQYLFENIRCKQSSLYLILKNLLPEKLSTDFHLMIVSNKYNINSRKWGAEQQQRFFEKFYLKFKRYIEGSGLDYKVKLSVLHTPQKKEIHDRHIFTNNYFIETGNSFRKKLTGTYLNVHPLNSDARELYYKELEVLKKVVKGPLLNPQIVKDVQGDRVNRLLGVY